MMNELTLEMLDEAIEKVRAFEREIIGFKVHPEDLRCIKAKTKFIWAITKEQFMVCPPYQGFILEADPNQVRGIIEPIKKYKDTSVYLITDAPGSVLNCKWVEDGIE